MWPTPFDVSYGLWASTPWSVLATASVSRHSSMDRGTQLLLRKSFLIWESNSGRFYWRHFCRQLHFSRKINVFIALIHWIRWYRTFQNMSLRSIRGHDLQSTSHILFLSNCIRYMHNVSNHRKWLYILQKQQLLLCYIFFLPYLQH